MALVQAPRERSRIHSSPRAKVAYRDDCQEDTSACLDTRAKPDVSPQHQALAVYFRVHQRQPGNMHRTNNIDAKAAWSFSHQASARSGNPASADLSGRYERPFQAAPNRRCSLRANAPTPPPKGLQCRFSWVLFGWSAGQNGTNRPTIAAVRQAATAKPPSFLLAGQNLACSFLHVAHKRLQIDPFAKAFDSLVIAFVDQNAPGFRRGHTVSQFDVRKPSG